MFESEILASLLNNKANFSLLFESKVQSYMFTNENYKILLNFIINFYKKYNNLPSSEEADYIISNNTKYSLNKRKELLSLYIQLKNLKVIESFDFLLDTFYKEYQLKEHKKTLLECAELLENNELSKIHNKLKNLIFNFDEHETRKILDSTNVDFSLDEYKKMQTGVKKYVKSGFKKFDDVTGGFRNQTLTVFQGWLKAGKSLVLLNIAYNAWRYYGNNVLLISGELSDTQLDIRFNALGSEVPTQSIEFAKMNDEETKKFNEFLEFRKKYPYLFKIVFEPNISTASIQQLIREMKLKSGCDLVLVDQLSTTSPTIKSKDVPDIARVAIELKAISSIENIPIVTVSQHNRQGQLANRVGTQYTSGSIEVARYADAFLTLKIKDEEVKKMTGLYELEVQTAAMRSSQDLEFTLKVFPNIMKVKDF